MAQLIVTIEDLSLLPVLERTIKMLHGVKNITLCENDVSCDVKRKMSRDELETKCFTLEESKEKILEKIHRHFHGV